MKTRILHLPSILLASAAAAMLLTVAVPDAAADRNEHHESKPPVTGTVNLKAGVTALTLAESFQAALTGVGVEVRKVIPGQFVKGRQTYRFPIRGGALDLNTLQAEFIHAGGLSLKTATTTVSLTDLIVTLPGPDPATDPATQTTAVSAEVSALIILNGDLAGRVSLCAIDLSGSGMIAPVVLGRNKKLSIPNIGLSLTAEGANALNAAFAVTAFATGDAVGTASILACAGRSDD
jgi:hypothetical protein